MQAGEHGDSGGVEIGRTPGDRIHELVNLVRQLDHLAGVARGEQRKALIEDCDLNLLSLSGILLHSGILAHPFQ